MCCSRLYWSTKPNCGYWRSSGRTIKIALTLLVMRQVLVDHARERQAAKRGGGF